MKNFILSTLLALFAFTLVLPIQEVKAQQVGVLVQPSLSNKSTLKGVFAETQVYNRIGIYADYKIDDYGTYASDNVYTAIQNVDVKQLNVGLSYVLTRNIQLFGTTSVINNKTITTSLTYLYYGDNYSGRHRYTNNRTYQLGGMYNANYINVLLGYETNKNFSDNRITVGVGVNIW